MNSKEINFDLKRDDAHNLVGFSLTAMETYAECYCVSFLAALGKGKARMKVEGGKAVFEHKGIDASDKLGIHGISEGGTFSADLAPEDVAPMTELLTRTGRFADKKFDLRFELAFARGFSIQLKKE